MTDQHFAIFDTPIGACGIVWGPRGINGVQLPMGSEERPAPASASAICTSRAAPTAEVQR